MSLSECYNQLRDPIAEKIEILNKDLEDAKSDNDPFRNQLYNSFMPLVNEFVLGPLGDLANSWMNAYLSNAVGSVSNTLGAIYSAGAMILTSRREMEIVAFAALVDQMKRDVTDRKQVLEELQSYVNILLTVLRQVKHDRTEPEVFRRVRIALIAMRKMVIQLYRVQNGLIKYQYMNEGALLHAQNYLDEAIEALLIDDDINEIFADGVMNARVGEYLADRTITLAKKKAIIASTILFCILEIVYRLPIPTWRLNTVGISLSLGQQTTSFREYYHDRRSTPQAPNWEDIERGSFNFGADYQGLHILNNIITVDKNLLVYFSSNWEAVKNLAKHSLSTVEALLEQAINVRDDMDQSLSLAQKKEDATMLHIKSVLWNAKLMKMKYAGFFNVLLDTTGSQNLSEDLRIMDIILNHLNREDLDLDMSEDLITSFLAVIPSLATVMFSNKSLQKAYNGLNRINTNINRSITNDEKLLSKLNLLDISDNPLYSELVDLYNRLVNKVDGISSLFVDLGFMASNTQEGILAALNPANVANLANQIYQSIVGGGTLIKDVLDLGALCFANNPGQPRQTEHSGMAFNESEPPYPTVNDLKVTTADLDNIGYKLSATIRGYDNIIEADRSFGTYIPVPFT